MNVVSVNCARARRDRCAIRTHCLEVLCCRARLQPAGQVCVCLAWKRLHRPRLVYKLRHLCSKFLSRHERSGVQGHEEATLLMMPHREKVSHNSSSNHQPGSSSQEAVSEHTDITPQRHAPDSRADSILATSPPADTWPPSETALRFRRTSKEAARGGGLA
jgi:hypothetical protein